MKLLFKRYLTFEQSGVRKTGVLQIHRLEQLSESKWACFWSLSYVHPELCAVYGEDALKAITNALELLSGLIRGTGEDGLKIWWHHEGDNGGIFSREDSGTDIAEPE